MDVTANREDVASRLKQARAKVFDTAARAARALGMKPVTVRAHEAGQNGVSYADLERYARRYGVEISWLLTGRGPEAPEGLTHAQYGEPLNILTLVEDGVWLKDVPSEPTFPVREPVTQTGVVEFAVYTDPRFPSLMIDAFKVATSKTDGPYINGTVVFAIPRWTIGYREGDDVIIIIDDRENGVCQWTLRRVIRNGTEIAFKALLSDSEDLQIISNADIVTEVLGVVVGAVTRRPVNELPADFHTSPDAYEADMSVRPDGSRPAHKVRYD